MPAQSSEHVEHSHDVEPQNRDSEHMLPVLPTQLHDVDIETAQWQPPPPVPISESDNPDAIALRAAITILQTQRDRAVADLRLLEKVKQQAVLAPEQFIEAAKMQAAAGQEMDLDTDDDDENEEEDTTSHHHKFPPLPTAQNVVRCPPVNWAKYHVVPESLDKLHAVQQLRPDSGLPYTVIEPGLPPGVNTLNSAVAGEAKLARPATVAAPYNPFIDGRLEGMKTRNMGRREPKQH